MHFSYLTENQAISNALILPDNFRIRLSDNRSSTFRSDSGYRTYSITAMRITSGDELKHRNGLAVLLIFTFYQHPAPTAILV